MTETARNQAHGRSCEDEIVVSPEDWPARQDPYHVVIDGAGFAGAILASRFAQKFDRRVLVVDPRGNLREIAGTTIEHYARLLEHPNIDLLLGALPGEVRSAYPGARFISSASLDRIFARCHEWRGSLDQCGSRDLPANPAAEERAFDPVD
ncbi:hypothetical protein [Novosphingobium sp. TH158]|uniref:hypothetical protein n=1 Tax=Novosphingobium sp. TH158 TaxID=2067455 RepID=UPI0020B11092|nr:hypothetical protein [Novosphingobium sp. TH158]